MNKNRILFDEPTLKSDEPFLEIGSPDYETRISGFLYGNVSPFMPLVSKFRVGSIKRVVGRIIKTGVPNYKIFAL